MRKKIKCNFWTDHNL